MTALGHQETVDIPHDLEAEESLIGAMILSDGATHAAIAAGVITADFYNPAHGPIFDALIATHAAGEHPDVVVLAARLGVQLDTIGGTQRLREIQARTPASANAPAYAAIVRDRAKRRAVIGLASELQDAARAGSDTSTLAARLAITATAADVRARMASGGTFVHDAPDHAPIICGSDDAPMWAKGESLLIVGPAGVGKTTVAVQLVAAGIGALDDVLDMPVEQSRRTLYLACDRPAQFRRALRRVLGDADRELLDERLVVWQGPPSRDFARHPESLLSLARDVGADRVFVDSLKDVALGISDDEVGAGLNCAIQLALAEGVDVCGLHHQRKGQNGTKPKSLEDVYGSTWITAGAGSVVLLWGAAGDPIVELRHLKQPAGEIGPLRVEHDHGSGHSTISRGAVDPLVVLRNTNRRGLTARDLAVLVAEKAEPNDNDRKKAERQLDRLVARGLAHRENGSKGGAGGSAPARYSAVVAEQK